ncbi:MAG: LysM peptidoglycan-binding domain-containing protein [Pseudomonadota bacterium]
MTNKIQSLNFLILLAAALVMGGCQTTRPDMATAPPPVAGSRQARTIPPETVQPSANLSKTVIPRPVSGHITKACDLVADTESNPNELSESDSDALASPSADGETAPQEDIEHSLELCQSAQSYWEKGELENALAELDLAYATILKLDTAAFPEINQQKEDIRYMISKRILEIYASRNIIVNGQYDAIPITLNDHVNKEIQLLTCTERSFFIQSLKRSCLYRPYIEEELRKAGLPVELSWLPLIESGFKTNAMSPARALGIWQFIPSTGYKFGLTRNYYIDERLDPYKSTQAAIAYLKELHGLFGDWSTVLAAYNCGEGRVLRIIKDQNINYLDNFWDLYEKLPIETARYVPRFLATLHIIKNLSDYDMTLETTEPLNFKPVSIAKQIRLQDIAREVGMDPACLKELNPELRYALLPPEEYELRLPEDKVEIFLASLDKIQSTVLPPPAKFSYHKVRPGETLSIIARKYKTSMRLISTVNRLPRNNMIVTGKVLKIPVSGNTGSGYSPPTPVDTIPPQGLRYSVKSGDNLWNIANRYGTTTKRIMTANNLTSQDLHIGQVLLIPTRAAASIPEPTDTYWVKSGDNPFTIAQKYNMTLERLLSLNHLSETSKIYPGQKLQVE